MEGHWEGGWIGCETSSWMAESPPAKKQPEEGWSPPQRNNNHFLIPLSFPFFFLFHLAPTVQKLAIHADNCTVENKTSASLVN
jgi:hypothetical protein